MEQVKARDKVKSRKKSSQHVSYYDFDEKSKSTNLSKNVTTPIDEHESTFTANDRERFRESESLKEVNKVNPSPVSIEPRAGFEEQSGDSLQTGMKECEMKTVNGICKNRENSLSPADILKHTVEKRKCVYDTDESENINKTNTLFKQTPTKEEVIVNCETPNKYAAKSIDSKENYHTEVLASKQLYPRLNIESEFEAQHTLIISNRDILLKKTAELANKAFEEFSLNVTQISHHEFFELVHNYYFSRQDLLIAQDTATSLECSLTNKENELWKDVSLENSAVGNCQDESSVRVSQKYSIKKLDDIVESQIAVMLKELESKSLIDLAYYEYSSQVLKYKIEIYIQHLLQKFSLHENPNMSSFLSLNSNVSKMQLLKICISILFHFQRKPTRDDDFIMSSREWLAKLISTLLIDGAPLDRLFILHHVLRCPGGINSWAVCYIQQPIGLKILDDSPLKIFECDLIKFSLPALMIILNPVVGRDELLKAIDKCEIHDAQCPDDCNFTILNALGEELDVKHKFAKLFSEKDILGLLKQIQLQELFQQPCFSLFSDGINQEKSYDKHMRKIITYAYLLLQLFDTGFKTFDNMKNFHVMDMIGQLLVSTLQFLTSHWINAKDRNRCHFCIQIEVDRLVFHAVYMLISLKETWKTLSCVPYDGVSPKMLWNLLWLYHCFMDTAEEVAFAEKDVPEKLKDFSCRVLLRNNLKDFKEEDVLHILGAMKNMALSEGSETEFFCCIAQEIFEVASSGMLDENNIQCAFQYICEIAEAQLIVISFLLRYLHSTEDSNMEAAAVLFKMLPFQKWVPEDIDVDIISNLILSGSLASYQNRLARTILKRMNWQYEGSVLALPQHLHQKVAILILKAFLQYSKNEEGWSVSKGIKQMLRLYLPVIFDEESDEGFPAWAWHMLFQLKLHVLSHPNPPYVEIFDGEAHSIDVPNLCCETWLHPIVSSYSHHHPVACYLVLAMTNIGHSMKTLREEGIQIFSVLMQQGQYAAATEALFFMLPFFVRNSGALVESDRFLSDLRNLITVDRPAKHNEMKTTVGAVLLNIQNAIKKQFCLALKFSIEIVSPLMKLWVKLLTKLLLENRNELKLNGSVQQVYHLLDFIIKFAFLHPYTRSNVMDELMALARHMALRTDCKKTIWQTWFDSSVQQPLLQGVTSSHCWYAYAVTYCEMNQKEIADLWVDTVNYMINNQKSTPEAALKRSASWSHDHTFLPIYRWGMQALKTPVDHPLLPLMLQSFFLYFLQRPSGFQGASIGPRFFEGSTYSVLLRKLKLMLHKAVDYYHNHILQVEAKCKPDYESLPSNTQEFTRQSEKELQKATDLFVLFQAFSVWIEDTSLHGKVCLEALSPKYMVNKLKLILSNNEAPWFEYVDVDSIKGECILEQELLFPVYPSCSVTAVKMGHDQPMEQKLKPPVFSADIEPSIPEIEDKLLFSSSASHFNALSEDQKLICEEAVKFETSLARLKQLNEKYMGLISNIYFLEDKEILVKSFCYRRSRCKGAAIVKVMTQKSVRNEKITAHISLNRNEFKKLLSCLITSPTTDIYIAAVHMEMIIRKLVSLIKSSPVEESSVKSLKKLGISLFYDQLAKAQEILLSCGPNSSTSYIPSKQFFATCIEILGKELIMECTAECKTLLQVLLKNPAAIELASPYFCPDKLPEEDFLEVYVDLVKSISLESKNVVFVILSKINLNKWLNIARPTYSLRVQLLKIVSEALCLCGSIPEAEISLVEDIIRKHFVALLMYEFPELFSCALENIMQGVDSNSLRTEIFYELFHCLGCHLSSTEYAMDHISHSLRTFALNRMLTPNQKIYITSPPLQLDQIILTVEYLHQYFGNMSQPSLYGKYKKYMEPITILLGLLSFSLLEITSEMYYLPKGQKTEVEYLWNMLLKLFHPWITPCVDHSKASLQFPWSAEEEEHARLVMSMFASCIEFHHFNFKANNCDISVLSYTLDYYANCYVRNGFRSYCMHVFHDAFSIAAWQSFYPTVTNMRTMCEVFRSQLPECHKFLSYIFMEIPWPKRFEKHISTESSESLKLSLIYMVELIVLGGYEPYMLSRKVLYQKLLKNLEPFSWNILQPKDIEEPLNLYVKLYNPRNVIGDYGAHLDFYVLQFLKIVSGFTPQQQMIHCARNFDSELEEKRCLFLENIISFTAESFSCDQVSKSSLSNLCKVIPCYFKEVETIVMKECSPSQYMSISIPLVKKILNLLNCIENQSVIDSVLKDAIAWLSNPCTPLLLPTIAAAGTCLTNMSSLTAIVECCIETRYLTEMQDTNDVENIHNLISSCFKVPEIKQDEYINSCVQQSACLCLYEYVLRRVCVSDEADSYSMLLKRILNWLQKMKLDESCEVKALLLWDQILGITVKLAQKCETVAAIPQIQAFCQHLTSLGQENGSFLGLFQSSLHSVNFRFLCVALAAYLLLQLPNNSGIRLEADAPGYVTEAHFSQSFKFSSKMYEPHPSKDGLKVLEDLKQLVSKKHFAALRSQFERVTYYVFNPKFCFIESRVLLKELALQVFPNQMYLHLLNTAII